MITAELLPTISLHVCNSIDPNLSIMKNLLFSLVLFFLISPMFAAIITVDNSANSAGQYTDLQLAVDNAAAGDTLHVIGSNTTYGNVIIDKAVTLIGAGYNPPNQFGLPTTLNFVSIGRSNSANSASGTKLTGIKLSTITWSGFGVHDNITIERCEIINLSLSNGSAANWVIQHNIITNTTIGNNPNCLIRNNIIRGTITTSDEPSVLISNNLFASTSSSGSVFSNVSFATIANNIFYQGRDPLGCTSSTFNNNITYNTGNNALPYGNNSGVANLVNVNPQFTNATSGPFDFSFDYRLQAASAGINAGTDGTDIGLYGSVSSFPIGGAAPYLTSPMPRVPQVIDVNIQNTSLLQGDPLNVQYKARKQN